MGNFIVERLGCPNCGAPYAAGSKACVYCGSVLIVTSISQTFGKKFDGGVISSSLERWRAKSKVNPDDAEAHFALGLIYLNSKLRDAALVEFREAVRLAPEMADAHFNLALTLINDGKAKESDIAEARRQIDYCVMLAPSFTDAVALKKFYSSRETFRGKDLPKRYVDYKQCAELAPDIPMLQIAATFAHAYDGEYEKAEECARRAIELAPENSEGHSRLSAVLHSRGKFGAALSAGQTAEMLLQLSDGADEKSTVCSHIANALASLGRRDEAIAYYDKAIGLNPGNEIDKLRKTVLLEASSPNIKTGFIDYFDQQVIGTSKSTPVIVAISCLADGAHENYIKRMEREVDAQKGDIILVKISAQGESVKGMQQDEKIEEVFNRLGVQFDRYDLPSTYVFKSGAFVTGFCGVATERELKSFVKQHKKKRSWW